MNRDRMLAVVAVPAIAFSSWLVWKEYGDYSKAQAATPPSQVADAGPVPTRSKKPESLAAPMSRGVAVEQVPTPLSANDAAIIEHAKHTTASLYDTSLPHEKLSEWIGKAAGGSARIVWQVNSCGDTERAQPTTPVCAEADIAFLDGTKFQALLLLGRRAPGSQDVQYGDASLLWAVYARRGNDELTPAPLSSLARIADQASDQRR